MGLGWWATRIVSKTALVLFFATLLLHCTAIPSKKRSLRRPVDIALIEATQHGALDTVQSLLETGAEPNAVTENGFTALMEAAERGHLHIVQLLLEAGADPSIEAPNGYTALMGAQAEEHIAVIQLLKQAGASK